MDGFVLGSSQFGAAIGLDTKKTRQKLWREMTGREDREPADPVVQQILDYGNEREPYCVWKVMAVTGYYFTHTGANQESIFSDAWRTTPDGRGHANGQRISLEVKCPPWNMRKRPLLPTEYMPQLQGQYWIGAFAGGIFAVEEADLSVSCYKVGWSQKYIHAMLKPLRTFMRCLQGDVEPKRFSKTNPKPVMPEAPWIKMDLEVTNDYIDI